MGWEIWYCDPQGWRMGLLDMVGDFTVVRSANTVGGFALTLPYREEYGNPPYPDVAQLIGLDNIIEFWRSPGAGQLKHVFTGFLRKWEYFEREGQLFVKLSGPDTLDLLDRRIIAYYAESSESTKTDYADDMIKEMVAENMGSGADDYSGSGSARDLSGYDFTIAADRSAAPSITKAFAWRNLLLACQDVALASASNDTDLYFDIVPMLQSDQRLGFEFRTYINEMGMDRTLTSLNPVFFGREYGNLTNVNLTYDYTEEMNYIYAGGQGEEAARNIQTRYDSDRIGKSIWNRREGFADARNADTNAGVQATGDEVLAEAAPRLTFRADLIDTSQARFGIDWNYGDKIECSFLGQQFVGMVKAIQISVNVQGKENIMAAIEVGE